MWHKVICILLVLLCNAIYLLFLRKTQLEYFRWFFVTLLVGIVAFFIPEGFRIFHKTSHFFLALVAMVLLIIVIEEALSFVVYNIFRRVNKKVIEKRENFGAALRAKNLAVENVQPWMYSDESLDAEIDFNRTDTETVEALEVYAPATGIEPIEKAALSIKDVELFEEPVLTLEADRIEEIPIAAETLEVIEESAPAIEIEPIEEAELSTETVEQFEEPILTLKAEHILEADRIEVSVPSAETVEVIEESAPAIEIEPIEVAVLSTEPVEQFEETILTLEAERIEEIPNAAESVEAMEESAPAIEIELVQEAALSTETVEQFEEPVLTLQAERIEEIPIAAESDEAMEESAPAIEIEPVQEAVLSIEFVEPVEEPVLTLEADRIEVSVPSAETVEVIEESAPAIEIEPIQEEKAFSTESVELVEEPVLTTLEEVDEPASIPADEALQSNTEPLAVKASHTMSEELSKAFELKFNGSFAAAALAFEASKATIRDDELQFKIDIEVISSYILAGANNKAADKLFETLSTGYDLDEESRSQIETLLVSLQTN